MLFATYRGEYKSSNQELCRKFKLPCSDTVNNYLIVAGNFLNWASDEDNGYIPVKNYIKKYKRPRVVKVKPPYEEEEFNMLASYFEKKDREMYLLLHFLWHTGCRCGETVNIRVKDIDLKDLKDNDKLFCWQSPLTPNMFICKS